MWQDCSTSKLTWTVAEHRNLMAAIEFARILERLISSIFNYEATIPVMPVMACHSL